MFALYTEQARRALVLAQEGARQSRHRQINTAHLLLGVVEAGDNVGVQALGSVGIDTGEKVRDAIEAVTPPGKYEVVGHIPVAEEARLSLVRAFRWSIELGNATYLPPDSAEGYVGVEHVLLSLLDKQTDTAALALGTLNQEPGVLRGTLIRMMAAHELIAQDSVQRLPEISEAILRGEAKSELPKTRPGTATVTGGFRLRSKRPEPDAM